MTGLSRNLSFIIWTCKLSFIMEKKKKYLGLLHYKKSEVYDLTSRTVVMPVARAGPIFQAMIDYIMIHHLPDWDRRQEILQPEI